MKTQRNGCRSSRAGIGRIELAVILAIAVVLVGLCVVIVNKVREASHLSACKENLRQIGLACHYFNDQHHFLPPALGWFPVPRNEKPGQAKAYGNVFFHLLPYIGEEDLYQETATVAGRQTKYLPWKHNVRQTPVERYLCPTNPSVDGDGMADRGWAAGCYAYNAQVFARTDDLGKVIDWAGIAAIPRSFPSGTSNTVMLAEKYPRCHDYGSLWAAWEKDRWQPGFAIWDFGPDAMFQVRPTPYLSANCNPTRASSPHAGGIHVCMGDASARFVKNDLNPDIWWKVCFPRDLDAHDWAANHGTGRRGDWTGGRDEWD